MTRAFWPSDAPHTPKGTRKSHWTGGGPVSMRQVLAVAEGESVSSHARRRQSTTGRTFVPG